MILTVLEAHVDAGKESALQSAYATAIASNERPSGLVRSQLIRDAFDPTRWRIQTWWESREALTAMRATGTPPAGILMFRAAGAEPATSIFEVVDELGPATR
jgi:heme-degrading monooxygenase HmoA